MVNPKISILIPSAYRPAKIIRCLSSFFASAWVVPFEILVSVLEDDTAGLDVVRNYPVKNIQIHPKSLYPGGAVTSWNRLSREATGDWLMLGANDEIASPDWVIEAWNCVKKLGKPGVVGLNDLHSDGNEYCAVYMVHKKFLKAHCGGHFIYPGYRSWWFDREIFDIGQREGCYIWAEQAHVEHCHEDWVPSEHDAIYEDSKPFRAADLALYETRKANNFPVDWVEHG